MSARNAFVSSSRPILFKEIDVAISDCTPTEIKSTLQNINEFIQFINCFRYRPTTPFDRDIELREQLMKWLSDKATQEELKAKAFAHWAGKKIPIEMVREKEKTLKNTIDSFMSYSKFAYLTATELAVISIAIQKLILFLKLSHHQIKDVIFQEAIRHKLNELVSSQEAILLCMMQHQETFKKNTLATDTQQSLPSNDILLAMLKDIGDLTGENIADKWLLVPDKSILFAIPDLPFGEVDEAKTAKYYFETCYAAHLASKQWKATAGIVLEKAGEWSGWCVQSAWKLTSTVVTTPLKVVEGGVSTVRGLWKKPSSEKQSPLNDEKVMTEVDKDPGAEFNAMTLDLHGYVEKMTKLVSKELEEFEQLEELNQWKSKITAMIKNLELEKDKCFSSCFRFFRLHEIDLKEKKIKALEDLLSAKNLPELRQRATAQMEGDNKKMVLAGRASRTKKMLEDILLIENVVFSHVPSKTF